MTLASLLLVVFAAFIHAGWNLLAKRGAAIGPPFVLAYTLMSGLLYAPWFAWVVWHDGMQWSLAIVGCLVLSGGLHLAYSLCLQRGYRVADLSVVYPVARGSGPALSARLHSSCWRKCPRQAGSAACCSSSAASR